MAPRYRVLLQEKADIEAEVKALFAAVEARAEKGGDLEMTAEEKALDDKLTARLDALNDELRREERRRELERTAEALPAREEAKPETPRFASLGEQLMAVAQASRPGGYVDPRLNFGAAPLGTNVGIASQGGFLLEPQTVAGIWQRTYELGTVLARCTRIPIGDNADSVKINALYEQSRADGYRWGGIVAYWVAEAGTISASPVPKLRQMEFAPKKLACLYYATSEEMRNPAALEARVMQMVPQAMAFMSEDSLINGDGSGKPLGILNSGALYSVAAENGQLAATIVSQNINKMWSHMWAPLRSNAVWLINQDIEPQLEELALQIGLGGVPLYLPPGGIADAPYGRLKGRPVIPVEYCQTLGTVGDIILADFSQYGMSDRGTIRTDSSIHVQFLTDQTAFRFIYEIDGQPLWDKYLTPAHGTNYLAPFVALATRS